MKPEISSVWHKAIDKVWERKETKTDWLSFEKDLRILVTDMLVAYEEGTDNYLDAMTILAGLIAAYTKHGNPLE